MSFFNGLFDQNKKHRTVKKGSFDALDRPQRKGYGHIFKQEDKFVPTSAGGVSVHHPNAHTIRMNGIKFE